MLSDCEKGRYFPPFAIYGVLLSENICYQAETKLSRIKSNFTEGCGPEISQATAGLTAGLKAEKLFTDARLELTNRELKVVVICSSFNCSPMKF